MTSLEFRKLALDLPEAIEGQHLGHADFRLGNRIFASLSPPGEGWAMVNLPPDLQTTFMKTETDVYEPIAGAWGRRGFTKVILANASEPSIQQALRAAWLKVAPNRLVQKHQNFLY